MICRICGAPLTAANAFCARCGTPVSGGMPAPPPPPPAEGVEIRCLAGMDTGKRFVIGPAETVLGRVSQIGMADQSVAYQHVAVFFVSDRLHFRCLSQFPVYINSQPFMYGELLRGQDFMIGGNMWHIAEPQHHGAGQFFESLQEGIIKMAGTEKLEGFSLKAMFSDVFKRRTSEEVESYLGAGTPYTTPSILQVQTGWPKPWLFLRVLGLVALVYVALVIMIDNFNNPKAIPGIMFMGALAVPLAVLVLFFELNVPRNVSFTKVLMLFVVGGALSLLCALFGYNMPVLNEMGISAAGIVEESAKLLAVIALVRGSRYKYILNGIL